MTNLDYFLHLLIIENYLIFSINNIIMSYTYNSINTSVIENQDIIYAFDIKIINFDNEIIKKKMVSLDKIGELLECKNNIKKIKIIFCSLNSTVSETLVLKKTFNNEIDDNIVLYKKNIIIYLRNITTASFSNKICINYQIINY